MDEPTRSRSKRASSSASSRSKAERREQRKTSSSISKSGKGNSDIALSRSPSSKQRSSSSLRKKRTAAATNSADSDSDDAILLGKKHSTISKKTRSHSKSSRNSNKSNHRRSRATSFSSTTSSAADGTPNENEGRSRRRSRRDPLDDDKDNKDGNSKEALHPLLSSSSKHRSRSRKRSNRDTSLRKLSFADDDQNTEDATELELSKDRSRRRSRSQSTGKQHRHREDKKDQSSRNLTPSRKSSLASSKGRGESSHTKDSKRRSSSSKRRSLSAGNDNLELESVISDDSNDSDILEQTPKRRYGTLPRLIDFSLSNSIEKLSQEAFWYCLTSRLTGACIESFTGAGYKSSTAPQTSEFDDERLAQRRKQALAGLPADAIIQVRILAAENLPTWHSSKVRAVVRVSIVNASTGEYFAKRKRNQDSVNEHERGSRVKALRDARGAIHLSWESTKCAKLCQQITDPVCISVDSGADSQSLRWDGHAPLLFNVSAKHVLDPNAMIFFEILEFGPHLDRHLLRRGEGFRRVAWAFLKIMSATGASNINLDMTHEASGPETTNTKNEYPTPRAAHGATPFETRLQIYEFPPESWAHRAVEAHFERGRVQGAGPRVYNAYRFKDRRRIPGHLSVRVGVCQRPERSSVHGRPKHALETERTSELPIAEFLAGRVVDPTGETGQLSSTQLGIGQTAAMLSARRHRMKMEPCIVPTSLVARLETGFGGCLHVQFSPDGQYLAAACQDGVSSFPIRIFNVSSMKLSYTLLGHQSLIYELAWQKSAEEDDPSALIMASASADGTVRVWAIPNLNDACGHFMSSRENSEDEDGSIDNSDDELLGANSNMSKKSRTKHQRMQRRGVRLTDAKCLHVLRHTAASFVYCVRFHPSSRRPGIIASGCYDGFVRLWDASNGTLLGKLDRGRVHHKSHVNALCFTNDGNRIISGDGEGVVNVWRLETGRHAANPDAWHLARRIDEADLRGKAITSVEVHPFERLLLVSAQQNVIRLFELRRYARVHEGFIGAPVTQSLVRANFSPDGQYVLSGAEDGKPHLWSTHSGAHLASKTWRYGFPKPLCSAAWHPYEHLVAFCAYNGRFPVLMYEALRETRDVNAAPVKKSLYLPDEDGEIVGEAREYDPERLRSVSDTAATVLSAIREERTRRLSAKLDALDLSDDENTRENGMPARPVAQLKGIDALRERFMQRRLEAHEQQEGVNDRQRYQSQSTRNNRRASTNQDSSSSDDEESKTSGESV